MISESGYIRTVYCDVDGVLADFVRGVQRAHALPWGWEPRQWECVKDPLLVGREQEYDAAVRAPGFCAGLPEYQMNVCLLQRSKLLPHVKLLTSPMSDCPTWIPERTAWLERRFPGVPVIFERQKANYARLRISPQSDVGHVLIDDSDENIDAWRAAGGTGHLVSLPWNSGGG